MVPLIECQPAYAIQSITYDEQNSRVVVATDLDHMFPIGEIINADIINCAPNGYNGSGYVTVLSKNEFYYPLMVDPGEPTILGGIEYLISMTEGYFQSTLVYRNGMFEVSP
jgi:hypothetical protein